MNLGGDYHRHHPYALLLFSVPEAGCCLWVYVVCVCVRCLYFRSIFIALSEKKE